MWLAKLTAVPGFESRERWDAPDYPQGVLPQNWGETEQNRSVTCMVLKATDNDRRKLALCYDEFRGPSSDLCRSAINYSIHIEVINRVQIQLFVREEVMSSLCESFQPSPLSALSRKGCGSPVVKVSDHGRHVMSSSPVPLKTRRVGQRCTLNLSRAETSSRWFGTTLLVKESVCTCLCHVRSVSLQSLFY
ncbi:uncharacterized protein TNCV_375841 [Trichonephila clavipes]|nr:uncharacterized protein TNCV_375841 [Trichonephila clavipes]